MYRVSIKKKVNQNIKKMPASVQKKMVALTDELIEKGPIRSNWPNYSKLGKNEYHCHLALKWVACWKWEKNTIEIEVYYAGSREKAPY